MIENPGVEALLLPKWGQWFPSLDELLQRLEARGFALAQDAKE